jgi:signal transduction histidine kinase
LYCSKKYENLNLKLRVLSGSSLELQKEKSRIFSGLFTGILLMAFIVSLILLGIFREKLNFWYAVYILLVFNLFIVYDGLDFQWIYPNFPKYASISRFIASCLSLSIMIYVMQLFCNQQPNNSRFFYIAEVLKYLTLLTVPLTFVVYFYLPSLEAKRFHFILFMLEQCLGILIVVISCFEKILQRYLPAIFYFSAVVLLLYSATLGILLELGKIDKNADTPNLLQISFIVEVILISTGILYKYRLVMMENTQLNEEMSQLKLSSIKELRELQRQEQLRIAEDLHDYLGGQLAALKFKMENLKVAETDKGEIIQVVDDLSQSSRTIAHNLRPPELHQNDLADVISLYLKKLNQEQSIHFEFIQIGQPRPFKPEQEVSLYKILLELITNVLKHSKSSEAVIQFSFGPTHFELISEDNGIGLGSALREGMGLKNIRKRTEQMQGTMHIDSNAGNTTIILTIPYTT